MSPANATFSIRFGGDLTTRQHAGEVRLTEASPRRCLVAGRDSSEKRSPNLRARVGSIINALNEVLHDKGYLKNEGLRAGRCIGRCEIAQAAAVNERPVRLKRDDHMRALSVLADAPPDRHAGPGMLST